MATNVSLMILPSNVPDGPPQILMERNGIWLDMGTSATGISAKEIKDKIDRLLSVIMDAFSRGTTFNANQLGFYSHFENFYTSLIPPNVRNILLQSAQSRVNDDVPILKLYIHPHNEWIPWEILHDGNDFLGLGFQIARLPILSQIPDPADVLIRQVQKIYNFLGEDVLDAAQQNQLLPVWEKTFPSFAQLDIVTRQPNEHPNSYPNVDSVQAASDADILHITCHGNIESSNKEIGWSLNSSSPLDFNFHIGLTSINSLKLERRPLVFGNACSALNSAGNNNSGKGLISGLATQFYLRGALNYIGSFAPISKQLAIEFASEFYSRLLGAGGQPEFPVGKALWASKQHYRQQANGGDPSYLFYCLYGAPETVYSKPPNP